MEVILDISQPECPISGILHVCGGDPNLHDSVYNQITVFSTYVEVILNFRACIQVLLRILHVCGGDPYCISGNRMDVSYSPRMWR